ncbi:uncharacterized protein LOC115757213 isoform X4 [Rhodamnia argentea]|uniref:Protein arginine methyltransferase NDUFAF7 n=2 Tax=Rhodamnia argentea TaxID=178133 RepID=A0ABM3HTE4_9MYRT|nr:uncharacterized protein LOC115757213 isoform X4 [Rhodamnia argentea]
MSLSSFVISYVRRCTTQSMATSLCGRAPSVCWRGALSSMSLKVLVDSWLLWRSFCSLCNALCARKDYMEHLDKIYRQSDISWFTPVELFKPWYAHGIAEAILRTANLSVPLKIYEIGGGSGTCAKGIMDYIKLNAPERVYNSMTYISVEISPSLAKIQRETVGVVLSHSSKFKVECRDATDRSGWGKETVKNNLVGLLCLRCLIIFRMILSMQKIKFLHGWKCGSTNKMTGWRIASNMETLSELYKPLEDPLIKNCLEIVNLSKKQASPSGVRLMTDTLWSKVFPRPRRCWLPTGCLKLLEVVHKALPKMSLIVSDFNYLPDVRIPGERAPLVSTKKDGRSSDYDSYLEAKGDADIFFPTDFGLLERIDHFCSGWLKLHEGASSKQGRKRRTIMLDTSSFMEEFGLPSRTRTKDGYNPLLDDFKNTKFYLSVPTHNIK